MTTPHRRSVSSDLYLPPLFPLNERKTVEQGREAGGTRQSLLPLGLFIGVVPYGGAQAELSHWPLLFVSPVSVEAITTKWHSASVVRERDKKKRKAGRVPAKLRKEVEEREVM